MTSARTAMDAERVFEPVYAGVARYYGDRLSTCGATPAGVDWQSGEAQMLRFRKLLALCDFSAPFSLNDVGCGYGALWGYLRERNVHVDYRGIDISPAMIACAQRLWPGAQDRFVEARSIPRAADYSVASGIFNVKLGTPVGQWEDFIAHCLREMHVRSRTGFAVNFRTAEGAVDPPPPELYTTTADRWSPFVRQRLGARVEIVAGYGLREFTLFARRT